MLLGFMCPVGQHLELNHFQAAFADMGNFLGAFPLDWFGLGLLSDTCACSYPDRGPWLFGALPLCVYGAVG